MSVSTAMKEALQSNVTFLCDVWKMTAADGAVAAYAAHTMDLPYNSVTYKAAPVEPARAVRKIGLEPDTAELTGVFDEQVTRVDVDRKRWANARIVREIVCYTDLTLGYALKQSGFAGKIDRTGEVFTVEFLSLSHPLSQTIGDLTSNTDRNRTIEATGIATPSSFYHSGTVLSVTSQRKFRISHVAANDTYFQNGRAEFTSGLNNGLKMEIKTGVRVDSNTRTEIELQLAMPYTIAIGDTVRLVRGYKGTRDDAKDIDAEAVLNAEAEWELAPWGVILKYEE